MTGPFHRLLALDMDGTLLNAQNELSPGVKRAVQRAKAAGVEVVISTGRRYGKTIAFAAELGLTTPVIAAGGALVKQPSENHRTWYVAQFPRDVLLKTLSVVRREGFEPALYGDTYELGFDFYAPRLRVEQPEFDEYLVKNAGLGRAAPDLYENPPPAIMAGFTMGTKAQMKALAATLDAELPGELFVHVLRSPLYTGWMCEIAPAGVSKWSGVRRLADLWNIPSERICAVGDDVNDLPMIRGAGLGVAMGNALPEVREAADRVAPRNDEDGVAHVVRWLLDEF